MQQAECVLTMYIVQTLLFSRLGILVFAPSA